MFVCGINKRSSLLGFIMFPIVFNYHRDEHNVLEVNSTGYDQCVASPNKGAHDSGNDKKTFKTHGNKYYICEWHCNYSGQKLKVPVLSKKL